MIRRLFGETKEDQLKYLGWRTLVSFAAIIISGIVGVCGAGDIAGGIILTAMFILWGIPAIRVGLNFLASTIALSRNVAIHAILFILAVGIAYILGVGIALLGIIRCIQLFVCQLIDKKKVQN